VKEREKPTKIETAPNLFVFCKECKKVLYKASEINYVTRAVATTVALDHARFFRRKHHVIIFQYEKRTND